MKSSAVISSLRPSLQKWRQTLPKMACACMPVWRRKDNSSNNKNTATHAITSSYGIHLSMYNCMWNPPVNVQLHVESTCQCTTACGIHLSMYNCMWNPPVSVQLHVESTCQCTTACGIHLSMYNCMWNPPVNVQLLAESTCQCTTACGIHLSMYNSMYRVSAGERHDNKKKPGLSRSQANSGSKHWFTTLILRNHHCHC